MRVPSHIFAMIPAARVPPARSKGRKRRPPLFQEKSRGRFRPSWPAQRLVHNLVNEIVNNFVDKSIPDKEAKVKGGMTDEFPAQPLALRVCDGHGMVRLLAYDEGDSIMLMERLSPGTTLRRMRDDAQATSVAASVMRRIWRPMPAQLAQHFPTVQDWGKGWARLRGPLPRRIWPLPAADARGGRDALR
jgi:Aminoglycoside/hydroxyurea antibiotic resistance kinase